MSQAVFVQPSTLSTQQPKQPKAKLGSEVAGTMSPVLVHLMHLQMEPGRTSPECSSPTHLVATLLTSIS